jgi:hypothetical protein
MAGDFEDFLGKSFRKEPNPLKTKQWRRGGILTLAILLSPHVFRDIEENRMDTVDFYDLAYFNPFSHFNRLDQISPSNRHQRHQAACWTQSGASNCPAASLDVRARIPCSYV